MVISSLFSSARAETQSTPSAKTLAQNSAKENQSSVKPNEEAQKLLVSISALVKDFFPKAKITSTDNSLHFEYKVHEREHPYNRRTVLSPDLDGILGDVELKSGGPSDRIIGVIERPEAVHSVLIMAPYTASDKTWLSTRLLFQPITPLEFMESFKRLVNSYDHPDDAAQHSSLPPSVPGSLPPGSATSTSVQPVVPPPNAQVQQPEVKPDTTPSPALSISEQSAGNSDLSAQTISKETAPAPAIETSLKPGGTASSPMDKYTYPEGHFKVMLPGSPQVKYSNQAGMRMVDYVYAVPEGTFNISYVILPEAPPNLKTSQLLDNMSQSVVNSMKGMRTKQYASSLQGFPGCQLEVPELANKPGQGGPLQNLPGAELHLHHRVEWKKGLAQHS